jgi:hypothetical protein
MLSQFKYSLFQFIKKKISPYATQNRLISFVYAYTCNCLCHVKQTKHTASGVIALSVIIILIYYVSILDP